MSVLEQLAESRIREWLERPAAEREAAALPLQPGLPLEMQLMQDVIQLDQMALESDEPEKVSAIQRRASELMLRLMIILEDQGRPLVAQAFAEKRLASRHRGQPR